MEWVSARRAEEPDPRSTDDPQVQNPLHTHDSAGGKARLQKFIKDQRAGAARVALGDTSILARNKATPIVAQKSESNATFVAQVAAQSVHAAQICAMFVQINADWLPTLWLKLFGWLPRLLFPFDLWFPATNALVSWGKLGISIYIPILLFAWKSSLQEDEESSIMENEILSFSFQAWRHWYRMPFILLHLLSY
jgi:hypothetical protein